MAEKFFPTSFIDSSIKRFLDELFITRKTLDFISDKKEIFICLKFLGEFNFKTKNN